MERRICDGNVCIDASLVCLCVCVRYAITHLVTCEYWITKTAQFHAQSEVHTSNCHKLLFMSKELNLSECYFFW